MKLLLQEIQETFEDFLSSDEERIMVLDCSNESAGWVLKSLETIDNQPENYDVFLNFGHEFDNTKNYFELIVSQLKNQLDFINSELEKKGNKTYEEFTKIIEDNSYQPEQRFWAAVQHLREYIESERQINWLLFPMQNAEEKEFFTNACYLIRKIKESKISGAKFILRETESKFFSEKFKEDKDFTFYAPKVDMDSISESMERQAKSNESTPDEKAQAQMLLAGIDVSNKDFEKANQRNMVAYKHFSDSNQKMQQSVTLNNMGDLFYFQQKYTDAEKHYERAVKVALAEKSQPLMIYQCFNLGNSLYMQQKLDEAFIYYESSKQLSEVNQVLIHEIKAVEMMGVVKYDQNLIDEAIKIWESGCDTCRKNKYKLGIIPLLQRLIEVFKSEGAKPNIKSEQMCKSELKSAKAFISEFYPDLVV
jgi:tetratricopeptide (TPR) repeat protein